MGKRTLDLDDRSARLIYGTDVWSEISDLLHAYSNIQAALTVVGRDADEFLPLRGPATIVVDAGVKAFESGQTDPEVLLGWTRRGVRVYSLPMLHAKVILAEGSPSFVLVGSADAVIPPMKRAEAVLVADEPDTVEEVRVAMAEWKALAGDPLTDDFLQAAVEQYRPAAPPRPAERLVERIPDRRPTPPRPTIPARPEPETRSAQPVGTPISVTQPASPSAPTPDVPSMPARTAAPEPQNWLGEDDDELGEIGPVVWDKPKYIYLAPLSREGRASLSALERLKHLRGEFRVRSEDDGRPVLEVEMFWREEVTKPGAKPGVVYREGWHVVPIQMMGTVRPTTTSQLSSPGKVLQSYTDYSAHPARTYYYVQTNTAGRTMAYRILRDMLAELGERPSFDHAYMMQHKVDAILNLWPEISYTDAP